MKPSKITSFSNVLFSISSFAKMSPIKKRFANSNVYWMNKYVGDVC
jgi:hypothetical protein